MLKVHSKNKMFYKYHKGRFTYYVSTRRGVRELLIVFEQFYLFTWYFHPQFCIYIAVTLPPCLGEEAKVETHITNFAEVGQKCLR